MLVFLMSLIRFGRPAENGGGPPYELGHGLGAACRYAYRRGQAALRSCALCRPPWRLAEGRCHNVKFSHAKCDSNL